jgi:hypothetical protein
MNGNVSLSILWGLFIQESPFFIKNSIKNIITGITMTSRMQSLHTTCPGCQEEYFSMSSLAENARSAADRFKEFDESFGEYEGILDRSDLSSLIFNYFVFKK